MVSLLSSGWDQVVPTCSGRQAIIVSCMVSCRTLFNVSKEKLLTSLHWLGQETFLGVIWSSHTVN